MAYKVLDCLISYQCAKFVRCQNNEWIIEKRADMITQTLVITIIIIVVVVVMLVQFYCSVLTTNKCEREQILQLLKKSFGQA